MKWFIASDIHGSAYYCRKMLERYKAENADRMLLLGDILYHGPRNDLPEGYAPKEVIEMLNAMKDEILCVRGNCEAEVDQMVLEFPVLADYAIIDLAYGKYIKTIDTELPERTYQIKPEYLLYPIPYNELQLNDQLKQNPGY